MKVLLLYYSGAGNTKYIAKIIGEKLSEKGHIVNSNSITEKNINLLDNDFDILFLGFPIIFRDAPKLVYKVFEKLSGKGRPIMIFCTKGLYSGNTLKYIQKESLENYFIPIGFLEILMPGTDLLTYFIKANSFTEKIFTNIHSPNIIGKINVFISKMEKNELEKKINTKWYTLIDDLIVKKLERKVDNEHKNWIGRFIVNEENCIKCMKCVNRCPRENIKINDSIIFGMNCDVCLYCINNCEKNAISINKKTVNKVKYSEEKINEIFKGKIKKDKPAHNQR